MLKFKGIISSAFVPYLYIYIQDQEAYEEISFVVIIIIIDVLNSLNKTII